FIAFGHCRVVEDRVAEVVDRSIESHDRLSDMNDLRRRFTDAMHAQKLARRAVEQKFEQAELVAQNLSAGDFAETGNSDLVGDVVFRQLLFTFSYHGNLGDRIQTVRHLPTTLKGQPERVAHR